MELVEENRIRATLIFAVTAGLGLSFIFELVNAGTDVISGVWISLKMMVTLGVAFFAFQNIFYQRRLNFHQGSLVVLQKGLGVQNQREESLTRFEGFEVKWLYSRIPFVAPKLELRLKHELPEWSLDVIRQGFRETRESFAERVNQIQNHCGLKVVQDESGIWKS